MATTMGVSNTAAGGIDNNVGATLKTEEADISNGDPTSQGTKTGTTTGYTSTTSSTGGSSKNNTKKHGHNTRPAPLRPSTTALNGNAGSATTSISISGSRRHLDPSVLLSRGYTGRYLGMAPTPAFLGSSKDSSSTAFPLTSLTADEIDKDLRHMQAYYTAVSSYRQQFYSNINRAQLANAENLPHGVIGNNGNSSPANGGIVVSPNGDAFMGSLHGIKSGAAALPVRIDPEEEKRLQILRTKIAKAEFAREEAEQHYVALRAHYVHVCNDLQDLTASCAKRLEFIQRLVYEGKGKAVAMQRVRVQMARDILKVLKRRGQILEQQKAEETDQDEEATDQMAVDKEEKEEAQEQEEASAEKMNDPDSAEEEKQENDDTTPKDTSMEETEDGKVEESPGTTPMEVDKDPSLSSAGEGKAASSTSSDKLNDDATPAAEAKQKKEEKDEIVPADLESAWNAVEDKFKDVVDVCRGYDKSAIGGKTNNAGSKRNNKNIMPWTNTKLPATPRGIPLLSSVASELPEKTLAFAAGNIFGSAEKTLCWVNPTAEVYQTFEDMSTNDENEDKNSEVSFGNTSINSDDPRWKRVYSLRKDVEHLESELRKEMVANKHYASEISKNRRKHDQWVSFLSLVRQETESVLYRHNVITDSEVAMASSEKLHAANLVRLQAEAAEKATAEGTDNEAKNEENGVATRQSATEGESTVAATRNATSAESNPQRSADDANDGDDEDSNDDEEENEDNATPLPETGEWTAAAGSKRSAPVVGGGDDGGGEGSGGGDGGSQKRQRRL